MADKNKFFTDFLIYNIYRHSGQISVRQEFGQDEVAGLYCYNVSLIVVPTNISNFPLNIKTGFNEYYSHL